MPQCTRGSDPMNAAIAYAATHSQGISIATSARLIMRTWPNAANQTQRLAPILGCIPSLAPRQQRDRAVVVEYHPKILYLVPKINIWGAWTDARPALTTVRWLQRKLEASHHYYRVAEWRFFPSWRCLPISLSSQISRTWGKAGQPEHSKALGIFLRCNCFSSHIMEHKTSSEIIPLNWCWLVPSTSPIGSCLPSSSFIWQLHWVSMWVWLLMRQKVKQRGQHRLNLGKEYN